MSSVSPAAIESGLSSEPPDPNWIVPRAVHHEQVLQAALARSPVLPTRFGCVFASQQALEGVTGQHRGTDRAVPDRGCRTRKNGRSRPSSTRSRPWRPCSRRIPDLSERIRKLPTAPGARYFLEKKLREEARSTAIRAGKAAAGAAPSSHPADGGGRAGRCHCAGEEPSGPPLLLKLALLIPRGKLPEIVGTQRSKPRPRCALDCGTVGALAPLSLLPQPRGASASEATRACRAQSR